MAKVSDNLNGGGPEALYEVPAGPLASGQSRTVGDAQEVWCRGGDTMRRMIGVWLLMFGAILLPFLFRLSSNLYRGTWQTVGVVNPGFGWVDYVLVLAAVVLLGTPLASGVWLVLGRTVIRLEPGWVVLRRRPAAGSGELARYRASDVKRVLAGRCGLGVDPGAQMASVVVVLELMSGEHVWLMAGKDETEARSVAWEVADYHGLTMEPKPKDGVLSGPYWLPNPEKESKPGWGVSPWDAQQVEAHDSLWQVVKVSEDAVEARSRVHWKQPWVWLVVVLLGISAAGGIIGLMITGWQGANGKELGPAAPWAMGGVPLGCALVVWWVMTVVLAWRVRVDKRGVTAHRWNVWGTPVVTFVASEDVRRLKITPVARGVNLWAGKGLSGVFLIGAGFGTGREDAVIAPAVHGPMGFAAGLLKLMEERLGEEDKSGAKREPGEGRGVDARGRVQMSIVKWLGYGALALSVGLACMVLWVNLTVDVNARGLNALAPTIRDFTRAMSQFSAIWACIGLGMVGYRQWAEVVDGKLRLRRGWWGMAWTVWEVTAQEVKRVWLYRTPGFRGMLVGESRVVVWAGDNGRVVEMPGVPEPIEVNTGLDAGRWGSHVKARRIALAVSGLLGVKVEDTPAVVGVLVNGVLIERDEKGLMVVPEVLPMGWQAGPKGRPTHVVSREGQGLKVVRRTVRVWWVWWALWVMSCVSVISPLFWDPFDGPRPEALNEIGWVMVGVWGFFSTVVVAVWLLWRERVDVKERVIDVVRVRLLVPSSLRVQMEDVEEVCVSCDWQMNFRQKVWFSVGVKTKDEEYVPVVTGIGSVEEAMEIQEAIKERYKAQG